MDKIRLLLVDDHEVVRTGLRMLLEHQPDMEIVGEASTGAEALELAAKAEPDVIVMDITLPDFSGIEATRRIKQTRPEAAVIALTIHDDEQLLFRDAPGRRSRLCAQARCAGRFDHCHPGSIQ